VNSQGARVAAEIVNGAMMSVIGEAETAIREWIEGRIAPTEGARKQFTTILDHAKIVSGLIGQVAPFIDKSLVDRVTTVTVWLALFDEIAAAHEATRKLTLQVESLASRAQ
jgi:hypothetical protein